jgi:hypothetical protein
MRVIFSSISGLAKLHGWVIKLDDANLVFTEINCKPYRLVVEECRIPTHNIRFGLGPQGLKLFQEMRDMLGVELYTVG